MPLTLCSGKNSSTDYFTIRSPLGTEKLFRSIFAVTAFFDLF